MQGSEALWASLYTAMLKLTNWTLMPFDVAAQFLFSASSPIHGFPVDAYANATEISIARAPFRTTA